MDNIRFIPATLSFSYEEVKESTKKVFQSEYSALSEYGGSGIEDWLKKQKAKGKTQDSDPILLQLLVELHKKVDRLESILKNENENLIDLQHKSKIYGIHFDYIETERYLFLPETMYYSRITLPIFPKKELPVFLVGVRDNIAKFHIISQRNSDEWVSLVLSKEREEIRSLKGRNYDS